MTSMRSIRAEGRQERLRAAARHAGAAGWDRAMRAEFPELFDAAATPGLRLPGGAEIGAPALQQKTDEHGWERAMRAELPQLFNADAARPQHRIPVGKPLYQKMDEQEERRKKQRQSDEDAARRQQERGDGAPPRGQGGWDAALAPFARPGASRSASLSSPGPRAGLSLPAVASAADRGGVIAGSPAPTIAAPAPPPRVTLRNESRRADGRAAAPVVTERSLVYPPLFSPGVVKPHRLRVRVPALWRAIFG